MVPVSARYGLALAALCALALIPVGIHSYAAVRRDDCAHPEVLVPGSGLADPFQSAERGEWFNEHFEAYAWREGIVRTPGSTPDLRYAIVRSYDPKRLYYRPQYHLLRGAQPRRRELQWLRVDGDEIPIHRSFYSDPPAPGALRRPEPVVAYLLVYRGEPVANPYLAQLRAAPSLLLGGSVPMTLFYVQGSGAEDQLESLEAAAERWLLHAWETYQAVCE